MAMTRLAVFFLGFGVITSIALSGCSKAMELKDVSSDKKFRNLVGRKYEIVGAVKIHTVKDLEQSDEHPDWLSIYPAPGISGTEIVSSEHLSIGQKFVVRRVLKKWTLFENVLVLEIDPETSTSLDGLPVYIPLYAGNEDEREVLNVHLYRALP